MSDAVINGLTTDQREDFRTLVGLAKHDSLGLVYTELDGKPVAVVMTTESTVDAGGLMIPLAILVDEDLLDRLTNPFDGPFNLDMVNAGMEFADRLHDQY